MNQHPYERMAAAAAGQSPGRGGKVEESVFTKQTHFGKTNPFPRPSGRAGIGHLPFLPLPTGPAQARRGWAGRHPAGQPGRQAQSTPASEHSNARVGSHLADAGQPRRTWEKLPVLFTVARRAFILCIQAAPGRRLLFRKPCSVRKGVA